MSAREKRFKRHIAEALPDYRSAKLSVGKETPEAVAHFQSVLRRVGESNTLLNLLNKLEPPLEIDGRKLTKNDLQVYELAVNYARGTERDPKAFLTITSAQARKASVRFFKICASAMEAVKHERAQKYTVTDAHRMAALQAKLELERNTGELPLQRAVKQRAFEIVSRFIKNRNQDFAAMEPENKRWSKILKSVNLGYLKASVRGKKQ